MTGSTALVTGAASGIGAEVARRLARRGHRVIAVDRTTELAAGAAADLGAGALPVGCDLADRASTAELCERIASEWQELDILVCNAGIVVAGNVADASPPDMDRQLEVLLRSPMQLIRAAVVPFKERNRGHVMATVSLAGIFPFPATAVYSAAKAGLRSFLAALNAELAGTGLHVSGIYPTAIDTPMLRREALSRQQRPQVPEPGPDDRRGGRRLRAGTGQAEARDLHPLPREPVRPRRALQAGRRPTDPLVVRPLRRAQRAGVSAATGGVAAAPGR